MWRNILLNVLIVYTNLQIILVDDGSTDNSGKICDEYAKKDSRIKVIHKKNGGVSSARNAGLKIAKGQYIGFVDGDDWIEKDMYEYLLQLCTKYKTLIAICEFYSAKHKVIYNCEQVISSRVWLANPFSFAAIWGKLFSKSIINGIWFRTDISMGEDGLFSTQALIKTSSIAYGPAKKYHYEYNVQSATKQKFNINKLTYFKAVGLERQCVAKHQWKEVYRRFLLAEVAGAVLFLQQIVCCDFQNINVINQLRSIIQKYWFLYLLGVTSFTNKCFALVCCINFSLARFLYKLLIKTNKSL